MVRVIEGTALPACADSQAIALGGRDPATQGDQTELALNGSGPDLRRATVCLLGQDPTGRISGLLVDIGNGGPIVVFKWRSPVQHQPGVPPAISSIGDVEPAAVLIDGQPGGQATIAAILETALTAGDTLAKTPAPWVITALKSALASRGSLEDLSCSLNALAAALAGPALGMMTVLARQSLLGEVWRRRVDWPRAIRTFDVLKIAGLEAYAAFALRPERRLPGAALMRRLARLGEPEVVASFVRAALAISDARERDLFEQALQRTLRALSGAARGRSEAVSRRLIVPACRLAIELAERAAFCTVRRSSGLRIAAHMIALGRPLGRWVGPINRRMLHVASSPSVRVAVLSEWIRRVEHELVGLIWRQGSVSGLVAQSNEVLEAASFRVWNCDDLRRLDWQALTQADWHVAEPVQLPDTRWKCPLPADGMASLSAAGMSVKALCSTACLEAEADAMHNCLVSSFHYMTELQHGRSRIYAITGALRLTLEFRRDSAGQWSLNQARGVRNRPHESDVQESDGLCWAAVRDFVAAVCALQSERG